MNKIWSEIEKHLRLTLPAIQEVFVGFLDLNCTISQLCGRSVRYGVFGTPLDGFWGQL